MDVRPQEFLYDQVETPASRARTGENQLWTKSCCTESLEQFSKGNKSTMRFAERIKACVVIKGQV